MRKKWKRSFVTALSVALAVGNCVPAMAASTGWKQTAAGWQYVNSNGSVQKGWFQDTDGKWYFLDYNTGVMKNGWIKPKDGKWYFMDYHTGAMKTGWIKPKDGKWYYLGASGDMKTGWLQTADGKYYYLDAASGAMQTGTITVNNQVWTLDANGVWDGKAASSVTYVSSGRPSSGGGSSSGTSSTIKGDGWTATKSGVLTINNEGNYKAEDFKKVGKIKDLIIADSVGDGTVTLTGVVVEGETTINGGGANTVEFLNCTLRGNIKMGKKVTEKVKEKLHVKFGEGTVVEGEVTVEDGSGVELTLDSKIEISNIIVKAPLIISGNGCKIINFAVETLKLVIIKDVNVEKATINKGAELQVDGSSKIAEIKDNGANITGNATLEGYYNIQLVITDEKGYWEVLDSESDKAEATTKIYEKTVKVVKDQSASTVLSKEGFVNPKSDSRTFDKWYTDKGCTEAADLEKIKEAKTLYAGWTEEKAVVPNVTAITATVSGAAATPGVVEGNTVTFTVTGAAAGAKVSIEDIKVTATAESEKVEGTVTPATTEVEIGKSIVLTFVPNNQEKYAKVEITVTVIAGK